MSALVAITVVISLGVLVGWLSSSKKGNRLLIIGLGIMISAIGIIGLSTGRLAQRHNGGPPLEGDLAQIASFVILGIGLYTCHVGYMSESPNPAKIKQSRTNRRSQRRHSRRG